MTTELDFDQRLEEAEKKHREKSLADRKHARSLLSHQALLLVASVPVLSQTIIQQILSLQGIEINIENTLEEAIQRGFCEKIPESRQLAFDATSGKRHWVSIPAKYQMNASQRKETLDEFLNKHSIDEGFQRLREFLTLVGTQIQQIEQETPGTISNLLVKWSALAVQSQTWGGMSQTLLDAVAQELQNNRLAEAQEWLFAVEPLEQLLRGDFTQDLSLSQTIVLAIRKIELYRRRSVDEKHLELFFERPEQIQAFRDFLTGSNDQWGLHFIGNGGVGKTMLIRHLQTRLTPEYGASARIDFDYINPDYPRKTPGLLLNLLVDELRLFDQTNRASSYFESFQQEVLRIHERQSDAASRITTVSTLLDEPEFLTALDKFAFALTELPQPVVIFLDTCEELAKLRPDGTVPENVEATFTIFEKLHERLPGVRVVFSGRRRLTSRYRNEPDFSQPGKLPERLYLELYEIQGFTEDEAQGYLKDKAKVREALIHPILNQSVMGQDPKTYNPFELALYSNWANEDTDLKPEDLVRADVDQYIRMRIVGRITNESLRDLLPAVALLGRFDEATLQAVARVVLSSSITEDQNFLKILDELSNQEWIDRQHSAFFEVDRGLQPRLRKYFRKQVPGVMVQLQKAILDELTKQTLTQPFAKLDPTAHFETVLRLSERSPEQTALWWEQIEARFVETKEFAWAFDLANHLIGCGVFTQSNQPVSSLKASVWALLAASRVQLGYSDLEAASNWQQVALLAQSHPVQATQTKLKLRAQAGQLAAKFRSTAEIDQKELTSFWKILLDVDQASIDEQLAGSFTAVLEALTEYCENNRESLPELNLEAVKRFRALATLASISIELQVFLDVVLARMAILSKEYLFGRGTLFRSRVDFLDHSLGSQKWLDWPAPDDLPARIALEYIRFGPFMEFYPEQFLSHFPEKLITLQTIDGNRLASARLQLQLALAPEKMNTVTLLHEKSKACPTFDNGKCNVHRYFPPLQISIAEAIASTGDFDRAINRLHKMESAAESAADDLAGAKAAWRTRMRLAIKMRLPGQSRPQGSEEIEETQLRWMLRSVTQLLEGQEFLDTGPLRTWKKKHYCWQTTFPRLDQQKEILLEVGKKFFERVPTEAGTSFDGYSCFLDCWEVNRLAECLNKPLPFPSLQPPDVIGWYQHHQEQTIEALRLFLRWFALCPFIQRQSLTEPISQLTAVLGDRRVAKIALEEGEYLSLRLPKAAIRLFEYAKTHFRQASDPTGILLAQANLSLAQIRSKSVNNAEKSLQNLREKYQQFLKAKFLNLPDWEELEELSSNFGKQHLQSLEWNSWEPWLIRIIACIAWDKFSSSQPQKIVELARQMANPASGVHIFPPDLDEWMNEPFLLEQQKESGLLDSSSRKSTISISIPIPTVSINPAGNKHLIPEVFGTVIAFCLKFSKTLIKRLITVISNQNRLFGKSSFLKNKASANIVPNTSDLILEITSLSPQGGNLFQPQSISIKFQGDKYDIQFYPEKTERGDKFHRFFPKDLIGPLRRSITPQLNLFQDKVFIKLYLDQSTTWIGWERTIIQLLKLPISENNQLFFQRHVLNPLRSATGPGSFYISESSTAVVFGAEKEFSEPFQYAWKRISTNPGWNDSPIWIDLERLEFPFPHIQLLHLIGKPIETSRGVRLEFGNRGLFSVSKSRNTILGAKEIINSFPGLKLCLLQCEPTDSDSFLLNEQEQAAYIRDFGAELHSLGVPFVLTIPPLHYTLAAEVLHHLFENQKNNQVSTDSLFSGIKALFDNLPNRMYYHFKDQSDTFVAISHLALYCPPEN